MVTPIGPIFQVNTYTSGAQFDPAIAIAPDGSFVVVWTSDGQNGGNIDDVFAQRFNADGTPAGPEFQVNITTDGHQRNADIAMDGQGNFAVVWEGTGVGDVEGVFLRRFNREGSALEPSSAVLEAEAEPGGDLIAGAAKELVGQIFRRPRPQRPRPLENIPTPGPGGSNSRTPRSVQGETRVHDNLARYTRHDDPAISMNSSGEFVVAWHFNESVDVPLNSDVLAKVFDAAGNAVSPEFRIHAENPEVQHEANVALNDQGEILFAWTSMGQEANTGTDSYGIFARRYRGDGPTGPEFQVNTATANAQVAPQIFIDDQGNSTFVWETVGEAGFFSTYHPNQGSPTPEFMVEEVGYYHRAAVDSQGNTVVTAVGGSHVDAYQIRIPQQQVVNRERFFSRTAAVGGVDVALNADGDGVMVWVINGEDGSGDGVFAQRFTTQPATTLEAPRPATQAAVASPLDVTSLLLVGMAAVGGLRRRWRR